MTTDFDERKLNDELDWVKSRVFVGRGNSAFLAPVMCSMEFRWDTEIDTAETDGTYVAWNPQFFMGLEPAARETVLVHELWHPALLHMMRAGDRDHEIWNWACDIRINNDLKNAGFSFKGIEWAWLEPEVDENGRAAEEDIYEWLLKSGKKPKNPGNGKDMKEPTDETKQTVLNNVIRAVHEFDMSNGAGNVPVSVRQVLAKFLAPVVPWERELMQFCTDLLETHYSWQRPNRRYPDIYLPSEIYDDGRLEHLCYYLDVSGSCSNADVLRFNSEVKYIKEALKPKKLTVCQFTTEIIHETVFEEDDPFEEVIRFGCGGTSFHDVRRHMIEHKPTAAIVFSDMDCPAMKPLGFDIPTIWVGIRASGHIPPFGKIIHIRN